MLSLRNRFESCRGWWYNRMEVFWQAVPSRVAVSKPMARAGIPRVALLIETARGYGRGVLRGIMRYARLHGPWTFYLTPGDFKQAVPRIKEWGGTGIIARIETPEIGTALLATRLPLIALDLAPYQSMQGSPLARFSELFSDSRRAGQLAAEHLMERGFRAYAFIGIAGRVWSDRRQGSFCKVIRAAGFVPFVYSPPRRKQDRCWTHEQSFMATWLHNLPKPIGIMACNDDRGRQVLEACREAGVQVPEEAAVVGVDNDELLCELADPPLSSVALNAEGAGYEAAALLARLMAGRSKKPQRIMAQALQVVARRSTDFLAMEDREVAQTMRYIHENAGRPLQVRQIVEQVALSRRALEIRFQRAVGRSIHEEILRKRLERTKTLLQESNLTLPEVAEVSGFTTPSYLAQVFRQRIGMTPARYRQHVRGEGRPD
jgi:LacI family transcriptional regulator